MSNEKDHIDPIENLFQGRFDDDEIQAPDSAWAAISSEIAAPASQALILKLKIGLAITTIAAITFGTLWLTEKNSKSIETQIDTIDNEDSAIIIPDTIIEIDSLKTQLSQKKSKPTLRSKSLPLKTSKKSRPLDDHSFQSNSNKLSETSTPIQDTLTVIKTAITDSSEKFIEPTQKIEVPKKTDPYQELLKKGKKGNNKDIFVPE